MNRKFLALILGLSLVGTSMTGCSSKKETEAETKAQTEVQTEAKVETEEKAETEAADVIEEAVSEVQGTAKEAVSEAAGTVEEAVSEAAGTAGEAVSEAVGAAEETVSEATETVEEAVSEAVGAAEETVSEAQEAVEEAATEGQEIVEEAISEAEAAAQEAVSEVEETLEETVSEAQETVEEAATEAQDIVEETVSEAQENVEEAVSEAEEAVEELATEAEEVAAVAAGEAAEEVTEQVEEATEAVTEEATEAVTEEAAEAVTEEAVTEAAEETEVAEEAVTEAAEEAVEAVTEAAEEAVTEAAEETEAAPIEWNVTVSDAAPMGSIDAMDIEENEIVILYNNDVHGGISNHKDYTGSDMSLGYAGMAAVKEDAQSRAAAVTTVDLGDAIQGSVVTTETDGKAVMDLMAEVGYDVRVPGNHEYDYGMDAFLSYAQEAGTFISCNFIDNRTGEAIFDGYKVISYDVNGTEFKIGYVGITTPETIAKSTPTYFQDEEGNYIYSFDAATPQDLYDDVQEAVDAAKAEGANLIVAVGHMGDTGVESDWSSVAVAANTTGIDVFLDGHAHSVLPGTMITDKEGNDVLLSSTGTKLENIGVLTVKAENGEVQAQTGLINELTEEELASDSYAKLDEMVQGIEEEQAYLFVKEGSTPFDLVIYDPETGDRLIRNRETNLGDFLTDAYREQMGADIAVMNGGSIRANMAEGDIQYMGIITVFPWNTTVSLVEVSGQVILDMLEMGARLWPEECGGFIQPSGFTYTIDTTVPNSVEVNSDGEFVAVNGEYRVKDVMVGDEPLDVNKNYKLAINTYYSQEYGDGMTMFKGCKVLVPAEGEDDIVDHDVIIAHLAAIGGEVPEEYSDPYGQGRITILTEEDKAAMEEAVTEGAEEAAEAVTEGTEVEAAKEAAEEAAETVTEVATE